ncbi:MAG TPA: DNA-directed RNA polymerase subunit omega [Vicinamibacterales bacterium]|nr:DNA-directed RNA polymerase subunit omega [Vicinamibacterales bacterium]
MIFRPNGTGNFEFVIVAALRAAQLLRGSTPRVPERHRATTTAQREVAEGKVVANHHLERARRSTA